MTEYVRWTERITIQIGQGVAVGRQAADSNDPFGAALEMMLWGRDSETAVSDEAEALPQYVEALAGHVELASVIPVEVGPRAAWDIGEPDISVAVDIEPEEEYVMLAFDQGVYQWVYADEAPQEDPEGRVRTTQVFSYPQRDANGGLATLDIGALSWAGDLIKKGRKVLLFLFRVPAAWAAGKIASLLESRVQTGLVLCDDDEPDGWKSVRPGEVPCPGTGAPVLLMVHGFLSNTRGAFDGLTKHRFVGTARQRYGAVLGFDHKTLTVDPIANANELLDSLNGLDPRFGTIDILTHSRGSLVYRSISEGLSNPVPAGRQFGKAVFTAAPNLGTGLADFSNWKLLLDTLHNLLARVPGWAASLADVLVMFVYALMKGVITNPRVLPGVHALSPGSQLVTYLNKPSPKPISPYYAISSDFEPSNKVLAAIDELVDRFFGVPNDLVVHTDSMWKLNGGEIATTEHLSLSEPGPHHFGYFEVPAVDTRLRQWLL